MANPILPVKVVESADLEENGGVYLVKKGMPAIPVHGFAAQGNRAVKGVARPVYVVSEAEFNAGDFVKGRGQPRPVGDIDDLGYIGELEGREAIPVWAVNDWPSPAGSAPSAPSGLTATENGATTIDLVWTDNSSDETGFEIERRTLPGGSFTLIHTTAAWVVAYADSGLSSGAYEYRVRAVNSFGSSAYSNTDDGFLGAYNGIPNLVHVYEPARRTLTSYTGSLVRIRRSSDNVEQDFGYTVNGDLDTAAIATFIGGGSGFVVTVYDQVGSNNPTQATAGNQPTYIASGQNGKPTVRSTGTMWLRTSFSSLLSQPISVYIAAKSSDPPPIPNRWLLAGDDTINDIWFGADSTLGWSIFANSAVVGGTYDTNWNLFSALYSGASSQLWVNSASAFTANAGVSGADGISIGINPAGGGGWEGDWASLIVANPSHSTPQREAMRDAINDYWAVY